MADSIVAGTVAVALGDIARFREDIAGKLSSGAISEIAAKRQTTALNYIKVHTSGKSYVLELDARAASAALGVKPVQFLDSEGLVK